MPKWNRLCPHRPRRFSCREIPPRANEQQVQNKGVHIETRTIFSSSPPPREGRVGVRFPRKQISCIELLNLSIACSADKAVRVPRSGLEEGSDRKSTRLNSSH